MGELQAGGSGHAPPWPAPEPAGCRSNRSLFRSVEIPLDQPAYGLRVQLPARDKGRAVGGRRAAADPDGTREPRQMRRLARQLPRRPLLGELEVVLDVTLEAVRGHE